LIDGRRSAIFVPSSPIGAARQRVPPTASTPEAERLDLALVVSNLQRRSDARRVQPETSACAASGGDYELPIEVGQR